MDRWGPGAQKALGRIVAYIELHPRSYLRYPYEEHSKRNEPLGLQVFADADFASDRRDRKSTSGLAAFVTSGQARYLVHWESNKQHVVSTSSAEAEVVALARAVKFTLSAADMFVGLDVKTRVLTDSEAGYKAMNKCAERVLFYSDLLLFFCDLLQTSRITMKRFIRRWTSSSS